MAHILERLAQYQGASMRQKFSRILCWALQDVRRERVSQFTVNGFKLFNLFQKSLNQGNGLFGFLINGFPNNNYIGVIENRTLDFAQSISAGD